MRSRCTLIPSILLALGLAGPAAAQDAGASPSTAAELTVLEQQLELAAAALSSGCVVACPALASMTRAAERICALDPGPRCADARARVRDAARRVRDACPECHTGVFDVPPPTQAVEAPPSPPPPPSPSAAPRHGGCAGCVVGADGGLGGAGVLAALAALTALARRRARSRRR